MNFRAAMLSNARARLRLLDERAARLEREGSVAELAGVLEEIGALEAGVELLSPCEEAKGDGV